MFVADPIHLSFGLATRFLGGSIYRTRFERAQATLVLSAESQP